MRFKNFALCALAALVVGCSSNTKELPPAELPKFQPEVQLEKQWSRSIGDGQGDTYNMLTPVVEGETIYAADIDGRVMSMDRTTGKVNWRKDTKLRVSGGVGIGAGELLLGTLDGEVVALDASNGEERWRARVPSEVLAAPSSNGDVVIVQTQDDQIVALEAGTGTQRWIFANTPAVLTLRGTGSPVVTSQLAIAGLSSGRVIALDTQRGLPVWEQTIAVPTGRSELERMVDIDGEMLQSGSTLYVVTYQGRLAALDMNSGRILWQREASSYNSLAQGYGSIYLSEADGKVSGIDEASTSALWSNDQLARRQVSAPAVFSSYVAVGDYEGYLHLLSQVDGRFVGRVRVDRHGLRARPIVVGDWLYAYGNGGELAAYTLR